MPSKKSHKVSLAYEPMLVAMAGLNATVVARHPALAAPYGQFLASLTTGAGVTVARKGLIRAMTEVLNGEMTPDTPIGPPFNLLNTVCRALENAVPSYPKAVNEILAAKHTYRAALISTDE